MEIFVLEPNCLLPRGCVGLVGCLGLQRQTKRHIAGAKWDLFTERALAVAGRWHKAVTQSLVATGTSSGRTPRLCVSCLVALCDRLMTWTGLGVAGAYFGARVTEDGLTWVSKAFPYK